MSQGKETAGWRDTAAAGYSSSSDEDDDDVERLVVVMDLPADLDLQDLIDDADMPVLGARPKRDTGSSSSSRRRSKKHHNLNFLDYCTNQYRKYFQIDEDDFPPYVIAKALSQTPFTQWTSFHYEVLSRALGEDVHLQAVMSHKFYVVCVGKFLYGQSSWTDPQMMSRLYVHDIAKLKVLERVTYSFMMCLQSALQAQKDGAEDIPGLDDPAEVEEMKKFVLEKGFNHHYLFCDHHHQHWTHGRGHQEGDLPQVVLREMVVDGLACLLERAGPFDTVTDWIRAFSVATYPRFMRRGIRKALSDAADISYGLDFQKFAECTRYLANLHCQQSAPRWSFMPPQPTGEKTLDTFSDCQCDTHVMRHVVGVTSCDCACCRMNGCHNESCRTTDQMSRAELQGCCAENDDVQSEVFALGGQVSNLQVREGPTAIAAKIVTTPAPVVQEPVIVPVKAQLLGKGDTGPPKDCTTCVGKPCDCQPSAAAVCEGCKTSPCTCEKGCTCAGCPSCPPCDCEESGRKKKKMTKPSVPKDFSAK